MQNKMILKDRVYGKFIINSSVLIELINSNPVQRLKGIAQMGVPDEFYHIKGAPTRYDHSIGVFLLLRSLGASEEEQIAGLLHDVSHTAFSHLVDWVIGEWEVEEFQNNQHKKFVEESEIPEILKKYGYSSKRISEHKHFKLLENEIPDVCADRIDYSLREFPVKIAKECFKNMTVKNNGIVFKNKKSAKIFANEFLNKQISHWGEFEAVSRYEIFAKILKIALQEKIFKFNDFWKDDKYILDKIKKSKNKDIRKKLQVLKNKSLKNLAIGNQIRHKKFRYVDPQFINKNKSLRLSEVDKSFKNRIESARKQNGLGILIPII